jgi:hypothetical protein
MPLVAGASRTNLQTGSRTIAASYTGAVELDQALFRILLGDAVHRDEFERQSGVRHRKKFDERLVLEKIYRSRRVSEVVWGERPDFRLRSRPGDPTFGVEVVRSFDSPSSASLRELPGYSEHLLSGGSVRHKQDLTGFTVTKVQIIDQDGAPIVSDYPAIMREQPPVAECVSGVCSVHPKQGGPVLRGTRPQPHEPDRRRSHGGS